MKYLVHRTTEPTTEEIIAALRLRCEAWGVPQSDVDRLERQIREQRAKKETIQ